MPSIIDRLAAADQVRRALDEGVDVRTLSDSNYQRCRAEMVRRATQAAWQHSDAADLARVTARYNNEGK